VKRVFVDSGGFFGLLAPEDQFHAHACTLFSRANSERWRLVTTNAVVIETHALLLARSRGRRVSGYDGQRCIPRRARADEERAIALVRGHEDKDYSLCDALSFVVIERLHIAEAIAFDRHFRAYGRFAIL
jgi:uncharacterized protein